MSMDPKGPEFVNMGNTDSNRTGNCYDRNPNSNYFLGTLNPILNSTPKP